jgi:hypothetical protein
MPVCATVGKTTRYTVVQQLLLDLVTVNQLLSSVPFKNSCNGRASSTYVVYTCVSHCKHLRTCVQFDIVHVC